LSTLTHRVQQNAYVALTTRLPLCATTFQGAFCCLCLSAFSGSVGLISHLTSFLWLNSVIAVIYTVKVKKRCDNDESPLDIIKRLIYAHNDDDSTRIRHARIDFFDSPSHMPTLIRLVRHTLTSDTPLCNVIIWRHSLASQ